MITKIYSILLSQTENMQNKSFSKFWCSSCEKRTQLHNISTTFETFSKTGSSWSCRYQFVNQKIMYLHVLLRGFQFSQTVKQN